MGTAPSIWWLPQKGHLLAIGWKSSSHENASHTDEATGFSFAINVSLTQPAQASLQRAQQLEVINYDTRVSLKLTLFCLGCSCSLQTGWPAQETKRPLPEKHVCMCLRISQVESEQLNSQEEKATSPLRSTYEWSTYDIKYNI